MKRLLTREGKHRDNTGRDMDRETRLQRFCACVCGCDREVRTEASYCVMCLFCCGP